MQHRHCHESYFVKLLCTFHAPTRAPTHLSALYTCTLTQLLYLGTYLHILPCSFHVLQPCACSVLPAAWPSQRRCLEPLLFPFFFHSSTMLSSKAQKLKSRRRRKSGEWDSMSCHGFARALESRVLGSIFFLYLHILARFQTSSSWTSVGALFPLSTIPPVRCWSLFSISATKAINPRLCRKEVGADNTYSQTELCKY